MLSASGRLSAFLRWAAPRPPQAPIAATLQVQNCSASAGIPDPGNVILFREKQARRSPKGDWVKVYGFADGSTQVHTEPAEDDFDAWEKQRLAGAQ